MTLTPHDFTKPVRLPTNWHERLAGWGRVAAGLANKSWTKQFSIRVEARVTSLEVAYARQVMGQLTEKDLAYRVLVTQNRVPTLLTAPRSLMMKLVGVLMGDADGAEAEDRELTVIEENLADFFWTEHWLPFFREAWPLEPPLAWVFDGREANPQCSRIAAPEDTLMVLNWSLTGPWGEARGAWWLPRQAFLAGAGDLSEVQTLSESAITARREAVVQALPLQMQVVLGTAELKLSELSHLRVGDLLVLDQPCEKDAVARIGNRDLFRGQPGRHGSLRAFQIKALVEN